MYAAWVSNRLCKSYIFKIDMGGWCWWLPFRFICMLFCFCTLFDSYWHWGCHTMCNIDWHVLLFLSPTNEMRRALGVPSFLLLERRDCLVCVAVELRVMTDSTICSKFAFHSLQTWATVALNCVAKDHQEHPSIENFFWNLQYSVQVQDGWTSSDSLNIQFWNFWGLYWLFLL